MSNSFAVVQGVSSLAGHGIPPALAADPGALSHAGLAEKLLPFQRMSVRRRYSRNETIFAEGESADQSYKVVGGTVRICKYTADGRRQIADFLTYGEFFGFMTLSEHSFTAEAVTDVTLLSYQRHQIEELGEAVPSVRNNVLRLLSQNIASMQQHLVVLGRQTARERMAYFLLRMADRTCLMQGDSLEMPVGRQDIADHLGLTVEAVCRVLSEFRRTRLITMQNSQHIVLSNVVGLHAIVDAEI